MIDVEELGRYSPQLLAEGVTRVDNDAGGWYDDVYEVYVITHKDRKVLVCDNVFDAPWQIGGNSGSVRYATSITAEEAISLLCSTEIVTVFDRDGEPLAEGAPEEMKGLLEEAIKRALEGGDDDE